MDYMKEAIKEAKKAESKAEVPVGAVIVYEGKIVGRGHNERTTKTDGTAHAEIVAIRKAGKKLGHWNLSGCEMYVTLEPCAMCAGAAVNSRISRIYFGAYDHRYGCCGSIMDITNSELNHRVEVIGGIREAECADLLKSFFKKIRDGHKERINN